MTETYIDTENKWDETGLPRVVESAVIVSAWMSDAEIAGQAASLTAVYGSNADGTVVRAPDGARGQGHYADGPRRSFAGGAGLVSTARDYARLGVLFQHQGSFAGRAVLSTRWVADSLQPDEVASVVHTSDGAVRRGRYQWFLTLDGCCYFAKGYNGQYVFVDRAHDVVIVRFGEGYGEVSWTALFTRMAESL